ncbi:MAG: diguanylate cyclase [Gemmatimonadales bacterium]
MAAAQSKEVSSSHKLLMAVAAFAGIAVICAVDFLTGVEYRVFPLYFVPLSVAAWYLGRSGALAGAVLCAFSWVGSNYLAGLRFSTPAVWVINFLMQGTAFVVVGMLIATVRNALARAAELSRTDSLTSLFNSRAFYEEAQRILARGRRYGHEGTLAYIDLDNFKAVNDTLGHHGGDDVIRRTADLIRQCIRMGDVSARLGGDEFVVLLPETGPEGAQVLLERLRSLLAETFGEGPCPVTASIGAVSFTAPPRDVEELVRLADAAMYAAKSAGKNRVGLQVVGPSHQMGTSTAAAAARGTPASKLTTG